MMIQKNYLRIIGLTLFFYILSTINLSEVFSSLRGINVWFFALSLIILFISPIFGVLKWRNLIRSQDVKVPLKSLCGFYLKGIFLGIITPGRLGEFFRMKYLSKAGTISHGKAFYSVLMDRLVDFIILIISGTLGIAYFLLSDKIQGGFIFIIIILAIFFLTIYFFVKKESVKKIFKFLFKIFIKSPFKEKADFFMEEFFEGMKKINPALSLRLAFYGFLYYLCSISVGYFLALSLGFNIGFLNLLFVVSINLLLLMVPITVLGIGTREVGFIFFLGIFGIDSFLAVAFSELNLIASILLAFPGAVLFLKDKK